MKKQSVDKKQDIIKQIEEWRLKKLDNFDSCKPMCEWHKGWNICINDILNLLKNN